MNATVETPVPLGTVVRRVLGGLLDLQVLLVEVVPEGLSVLW